MLYIVKTNKDVETAFNDLSVSIKSHGFGILQTYDLKEKLKEKNVALANECRIIEVCNPKQAARILTENMTVSLALPCRIAVYEEHGETKIGTLRPTSLLAVFPGAEDHSAVANEVEKAILHMIDDAI
ncbi:MAG: DUF302 domain-containing protein [Proteobacteria bacterium]|nr:DUF302 domain-containing protein [Pseudomonadota bacterium]MBU1709773.1 DUF302 domain-containing protein [Pseudomonadota bacterium]